MTFVVFVTGMGVILLFDVLVALLEVEEFVVDELVDYCVTDELELFDNGVTLLLLVLPALEFVLPEVLVGLEVFD